MIDNQFYPTPKMLQIKMWEKFENRGGEILDPSAGRADLIRPYGKYASSDSRHYSQFDVIEIDFENQAILRDLGCNVVGHDFLQFECKKIYKRIIMNPPFNVGAKHVLKAWEILVDGEIVALVNAQTLKNPSTKEQTRLTHIIEDNGGDIEYLSDTFMDPDTKRKTSVEVAIIHLEKKNTFTHDFITQLKPDISNGGFEASEAETGKQLAIPSSTIDQAIVIFDAAVKCLKDEMEMTNQLKQNTNYYCGLLAESIVRSKKEQQSQSVKHKSMNNDDLVKAYNERYEEIKERAWSHILTATKTGRNLTNAVYTKLSSQFDQVKKLEFTKVNIHGFLYGLVEQRQTMNLDMLCELFDTITRFHSDNRCYYKGWKSNDKHKNAYRIVMTRFILPVRSDYSGGKPNYDELRKLRDFDLAFALLDGKDITESVGITNLFDNEDMARELADRQRVSATYFDIRYYPLSGTMHFFPRHKKLIARLNRIVGRERQWLPPEGQKVDDNFWLQYDKAESVTAKMRKDRDFCRQEWGVRHDEMDLSEFQEKAARSLGIPVFNRLDSETDQNDTQLIAA